MTKSLAALACLSFLLTIVAKAQHGSTVGPEKGWLIINGGGGLPDQTKSLFVSLAGGRDANFVVIPTAEEDADIDIARIQRTFPANFGVQHVTVLHTRDRARANSDGFVSPLKHANGVFIQGGRQWRLADAYLETAVEQEIKALLARGGVVCGGSAGATIQGSYLVRGAPQGSNIVMSPGHETGFGLLPDSAIDQHMNTRGREKDLNAVIEAHPNLLGIGLDEQTSIVVHGDLFKVIGPGQVAIHDGKDHNGAQYYFLSSGQVFNLKTREPAGAAETLQLRPAIPPAAVGEQAGADKYPLTLTVKSALRRVSKQGTTTTGTGLLASNGDPTKPPERINFECEAGVYSRAGMNTYPARQHKPYQIKIAVREEGSDKVHEATCKY